MSTVPEQPRASERDAGAPAAASARPGYANYVLAVLFTVYVFNFIDRQILSILLQPIKDDLGVSDSAMGFLTGFAFAVFYTFMGIPIARWADRGSRVNVISVGLVIWSAMTALSGAAQSFAHLALARIGVGVGEAAGSPPSHSLISDYFPPQRRARALGLYSMGIHFGILFGFFFGGWLYEFFGWRAAFMVVGLPGLAVAVLLRTTVREPPRGQSEGLAVDDQVDSVMDVFRFMWRLRSFRYMSLATSLVAFTGYGFITWVPTFLVRVHGMGYGEIGTWIGLEVGFAGAAGAFLGGLLADRGGLRDARWYMWWPAIATLVGTPFSLAFLLLPDQLAALLVFIPGLLLGAFYLGPTFSMTQGLAKPRMRAMASAILLFIINIIGLGAGPQTVGILNDLLNPAYGDHAVRYSLLIVGFINVVAAALYFLAARTLRADLRAKQA